MISRILSSCRSTNDEARAWALEGAPHGAWIASETQEVGRGRRGRHWESLPGNLFLSVVLRPTPLTPQTWIPLGVAAGAAAYLKQEFPSLPLRLKWPNDLWVRGRKIGGVLCEAVGQSQGVFVIAGMGLNCATFPTEGLLQEATSLREELGREISPSEIRAGIAESIREWVDGLASGVDRTRAFYDEHAEFRQGSRVEWEGGSGRVLGLGLYGELRVEKQGGEALSLYAEDVKVKAALPKAD